ncbi:MAG TPA: metallophosphoesterase, partial [Gemmatimonadales bacterium]|nr:metallophosphoesterase [Gemmatimonadales bacterium]
MFVVVSTLVTVGALWVVYTWATEAFGWFAGRADRKLQLAGALVLLVAIDRICGAILLRWHGPAPVLVHSAMFLVFATMVLGAAPVLLLRAGSRAHALWRGPRGSTSDAALTRRQVVEGAGGAALFGATGAMLGWGMIRGRHEFELREVPVRVPGLPRVLDGYVVVQVSDIHGGTFMGERELGEGLALVRAARPDLIVVTGDLVDFDAVFAAPVAAQLAALPSRDGITAVLGNHDYYAGADAVADALRAAGITVLVNEGRRIRPADDGGFALLGVDDISAVRRGRAGPLLGKAIATVPTDLPRILLSHQPITVDDWAGEVALQLSGHTHG